MTIRSMHKSGLIRTDTDDREAILNYVASAETTHKILYFHNTIFKLESEFGMNLICLSPLQ